MSKSRALRWIVVAIVVIAILVSLRPDVSLAIGVIDRAWMFPQGDWRVKLAADYLIWTEHPRIYDGIDHFLWACHGNPDYTDYRAEITAYILGSVPSGAAVEALTDGIRLHHPEGPTYCQRYVWDGLVLQGEAGYKVIKEAAEGEFAEQSSFRVPAMILLGETGDPKYFDLLVEFLENEESPANRLGAAESLGALGLSEAIEYLDHAARSDPSEEVRQAAIQAIANIRASK